MTASVPSWRPLDGADASHNLFLGGYCARLISIPQWPRTQLRYCSAVAAALPMKYRISLLETPLTTR